MAVPHGGLPLARINLVLRSGAGYEPPDKGGLAYLVGESLEGGTAQRSAEDIAWELERLGTELSVDVGWDSITIGMTVMRDRLEAAAELLADIARRPSFPEGEVRRQRDLQIAALLQRVKEPGALANDMAARFIFARDVPYARPLLGLAPVVEGLTRADVLAFYRREFVPPRCALLLVGEVDGKVAERIADRHFGDWTGEAAAGAEFEVRPGVERTTIFLVDRPGAVQSEIRIGDVGVERAHPDYFPLVVMNTILGGAFTSRLNMSLRERHGFTYGVRSGFAFRRRPGPFSVDAAVATEVTAMAVREALKEVRTLREEGPTEQEVADARDYLAGVLPLRLQTAGQVAARIADIFVHQLEDDYLRRYRERVQQVTVEDVARVAEERLRTDRLTIVVVGDASSVRTPLEELGAGPVQVETVGQGEA